jgi:hypothetical protein
MPSEKAHKHAKTANLVFIVASTELPHLHLRFLVLQVQIAQGKYGNIGVCRFQPHTVASVQIACLFKVALKSLLSV